MTRSFLLLGLLYLVACQNPITTGSTPPLTYEEKSQTFEECLGGACAKIALTFPVFKGDTVLAKVMNKQIKEKNLQMWVIGNQQYEEMEDAVTSFFNSYKDSRADFPEAIKEWTFETIAKVTFQSDSLISIKFDNFSYLGGAHPNTVVTYLNLDLSEEGALLTHEKMLANQEELLVLAKEKFREHHDVEPGVDLEEDGRFFLDEDKFFLPFAIGYEDNELVLIYNSYEIGPYVMGRTELRFPLNALEGVVYGGN